MKRILILILAVLLLCPAALADTQYTMQVIDCAEWVSLRAAPDVSAQRLAQVPLGAELRGYYASNGEFSLCEYNGVEGYILNEYLAVLSGEAAADVFAAEPDTVIPMPDGSLRVWTAYGDVNEMMKLQRCDAQGRLMWSYSTESLMSSELTFLTVFLNLPAGLVMVHNADFGLVALDAWNGSEIWSIGLDTVHLGASIAHAVDDYGTMYIGGYYGPDPVAISPDGRVLWQAVQQGEEFFWLYDIIPVSDGIEAYYEGPERPAVVKYDLQGRMVAYEYLPFT